MDPAKRERLDTRLREMFRHYKKKSAAKQPPGTQGKRGDVIRRRQGQPDKQIPISDTTMT